jgi:hypothetical protein
VSGGLTATGTGYREARFEARWEVKVREDGRAEAQTEETWERAGRGK